MTSLIASMYVEVYWCTTLFTAVIQYDNCLYVVYGLHSLDRKL